MGDIRVNRNMAQPDRINRIDRARELFKQGKPLELVQRLTNLSVYLLSILQIPEPELTERIASEGRRDWREAMRNHPGSKGWKERRGEA